MKRQSEKKKCDWLCDEKRKEKRGKERGDVSTKQVGGVRT